MATLTILEKTGALLEVKRGISEKRSLTEKEKWAYLAGLIDADGCICLCKKGNRVHYVVLLSFCNTNKEVVDYVAKELDVNSHYIQPERYIRNAKKLYTAHLWSRSRTKKVLEKMLPYLIIKWKRAKLAIEYQTLHKWRQGMRTPLLPREEEIFKEMKLLNHQGLR